MYIHKFTYPGCTMLESVSLTKYKSKTTRCSVSERALQDTAKMVREQNMSIRSASEACSINRIKLRRFINKEKKEYNTMSAAHRAFTNEEEAELASHCICNYH